MEVHTPTSRINGPAARHRTGWLRYRSSFAVLLAAALGPALLTAGCDRRHAAAPSKDSPGATKSASHGPVELTVTAQPAEADVWQPVEIEILAVADEGVIVQLADYEQILRESDLGYDLRIANVERAAAVPLSEDRLSWQLRCTVEFLLAGDYELPPASLTYQPVQSPDDSSSPSEPVRVETEPLQITISENPQAALSQEELAKIRALDPVELPPTWSRWWWIAPLAAAVMATAAVLLFWLASRVFPPVRRIWNRLFGRPGDPVVEEPPAHEWARARLAELLSDDLLTRGMIQEFYYRISGIVRGYIERRFAVSAPEMTTEEFLLTAAADPRLARHAHGTLDSFLEACDLVKYARHQPAEEDAAAMIRTASDFIDQTRARPSIEDETPPPPRGTPAPAPLFRDSTA